MNCSVRIMALALLGLVLMGCDDGRPGPAGPAGPAGEAGPPGASGNRTVATADRINVSVDGVSIPSDGATATVSFRLSDDEGFGLRGLPAGSIRFVLAQLSPGSAGSASEWQSYVTRDSAGIPDAQADGEAGSAGTFVDNGDGSYQYTFARALDDYPAGPAFNFTKTHRLGVEIRGQAPISSNAVTTFVPAGGSPTFTRAIVDDDTCKSCHDQFAFHGGPRSDVDYCVTCHNPYSIDGETVDEAWGGSVNMTVMIHKIHAGAKLTQGYFIVGFGGTVHDYSGVVFPQNLANCQTCHDESDTNTPEASNWRLVPNRAACGSCHDYIDWDSDGADGHPPGVALLDDNQCADCHGPDSVVDGGAYRVANVHRDLVEEASARFRYNIVDVMDTAVGDTPTVMFSVTDPLNGNAPYDIQNDAEFTTCQFGASRLAISIGWDTTDYTNTGSGRTPAQPVSMNPLTACGGTSTAEGGGVFSVVSPTPVPAGTSGTLAVMIDGHPAVDIAGTTQRIAVTNVVAYFGVTDAEPVPRRNAVAIEKCDDCHNKLSVHGNNRTDEPEVCVVCHNPNATDVNQRVPVAMPTVPPTDCVSVLGSDDTSIDMKYMIHALHAGGTIGVPYEVCGFGNTPHVYDFKYPGKLNNCEGCHLPGGYYPEPPGARLGTTVDVGADPAVPTDDTVVSPNSAVCSACHTTTAARNHMLQNGGDFAASKAADSSLISSSVENCEVCHGAGRVLDVAEVHGVGDFEFN